MPIKKSISYFVLSLLSFCFLGLENKNYAGVIQRTRNFTKVLENRNLKIAEDYLKKGIMINLPNKKTGLTFLYLAVINNNYKMVKLLVKHGADVNIPNKYGMTPLMFAVFAGKFEIVKLLIDSKANVNAIYRDEITALSLAALTNNLKMSKLLVENNATITFRAAASAAFRGSISVLRFFKQQGYNLNIVKNDKSLLMIAIQQGRLSIISFLLKNAVNINFQDKYGYTALMNAVYLKNLDTVKLLIKYKANVNHKAKDGSTPLSLARKSKNQEIIEYLKSKGAK